MFVIKLNSTGIWAVVTWYIGKEMHNITVSVSYNVPVYFCPALTLFYFVFRTVNLCKFHVQKILSRSTWYWRCVRKQQGRRLRETRSWPTPGSSTPGLVGDVGARATCALYAATEWIVKWYVCIRMGYFISGWNSAGTSFLEWRFKMIEKRRTINKTCFFLSGWGNLKQYFKSITSIFYPICTLNRILQIF